MQGCADGYRSIPLVLLTSEHPLLSVLGQRRADILLRKLTETTGPNRRKLKLGEGSRDGYRWIRLVPLTLKHPLVLILGQRRAEKSLRKVIIHEAQFLIGYFINNQIILTTFAHFLLSTFFTNFNRVFCELPDHSCEWGHFL